MNAQEFMRRMAALEARITALEAEIAAIRQTVTQSPKPERPVITRAGIGNRPSGAASRN